MFSLPITLDQQVIDIKATLNNGSVIPIICRTYIINYSPFNIK